jgi:hypothetical protein
MRFALLNSVAEAKLTLGQGGPAGVSARGSRCGRAVGWSVVLGTQHSHSGKRGKKELLLRFCPTKVTWTPNFGAKRRRPGVKIPVWLPPTTTGSRRFRVVYCDVAPAVQPAFLPLVYLSRTRCSMQLGLPSSGHPRVRSSAPPTHPPDTTAASAAVVVVLRRWLEKCATSRCSASYRTRSNAEGGITVPK